MYVTLQSFIEALPDDIEYEVDSYYVKMACVSERCPCGSPNEHKHLHVYFRPGAFPSGWCYRCNQMFSLARILSKITGRSIKDTEAVFLGSTIQSKLEKCLELLIQWDTGSARTQEDIGGSKDVEMPLPREFIPIQEGDRIPYLEYRGVRSDYAQELGLGYCLEGFYKDRIIIPTTCDRKVVGFSARAIYGPPNHLSYYGKKNWVKEHKYKKILYPKGFKAAQHVHMLDRVEKRDLVITEGPFDAINVFKFFRNGVCLFGLRMSIEQMIKIKKTKPMHVYVLLDPGAEKEAISITKDLKTMGLRVWRCKCPEGKDPGSMTKDELEYALTHPVEDDTLMRRLHNALHSYCRGSRS